MSSISSGTTATTTLIHSGDTTGQLVFKTNDTGSGGTTAMTIDTSQNVGIGTTTPSAWGSSWKVIQGSAGSFANYSNSLAGIYTNMYQNSGGTNTYVISAQSAQYIQYQGSHIWATAPSGTAGNAITFTQVLAVDKAKTLALEGATSVSGTGISFPATQSASTDANTLDDYEEGTWTPSVYDAESGGNAATLSRAEGFYTKCGNVVTYFCNIVLSSKGSMVAGNNVIVRGLPFTTKSNTGGEQSMFPIHVTNASSLTNVNVGFSGGFTLLNFSKNAAGSLLLVSDLNSNSVITFAATVQVN